MCGTLEILKDENPLERVTRPGTISANFSNIRRVEQVRSCAHMRLVIFSGFGSKITLQTRIQKFKILEILR